MHNILLCSDPFATTTMWLARQMQAMGIWRHLELGKLPVCSTSALCHTLLLTSRRGGGVTFSNSEGRYCHFFDSQVNMDYSLANALRYNMTGIRRTALFYDINLLRYGGTPIHFPGHVTLST